MWSGGTRVHIRFQRSSVQSGISGFQFMLCVVALVLPHRNEQAPQLSEKTHRNKGGNIEFWGNAESSSSPK